MVLKCLHLLCRCFKANCPSIFVKGSLKTHGVILYWLLMYSVWMFDALVIDYGLIV